MKLEIDGLTVAYGRTQVLFGVDLHVPSGALVCVMGRNGVGKTTLLNAVTGLLPIRSGQVRLDGTEIGRMSPFKRARAGIGYVPQGHPVFPHLTARQNLEVVAKAAGSRAGGSVDERVDEVLEIFPALRRLLGRPAGLLSGGQAQQLAIARTLTTRPGLLILDEPTEGIQPSIIMEIEDAIARLHATTGMTIVLVEQYVEFAMRLADDYAVMEGGTIVAAGSTADADAEALTGLLAI
ncbi:urea ABC transporter ATP-binding subunit UrtE [Desertimonas flava]|uniref:urea ABC transporter ATP-binding subunit UrtE n=1 Tax=Desertimonas flava TaxID=2064846 RepID=UPI000E344857|nr:urea ABC transporter ATP-binding subunit UrtE [Desertimonas flava]